MSIQLRPVTVSDIPFMLEWMHDEELSSHFVLDFMNMTQDEVAHFVAHPKDSDLHLAICDDGEYLGTISLKNIDKISAEYAISLRRKAIGKGVAKCATELILHKAFFELGLQKVYLNVFESNVRAIKFYKKMGFTFDGTIKNHVYARGEWRNLCFYSVCSQTHPEQKRASHVEFCELGDDRGKLVVLEGIKDVPFDIKRVFYIYGSDGEVVRGKHANRHSSFVLINVSGTSKVMVDYGHSREIFELKRPRTGVYIPPMIWKDMYDFSPDSVLLVLSDMPYDPTEYISDKSSYLKEIGVVL